MKEHVRYLLAIDTATPCSTVALTTGTRRSGKVVASLSLSSNITHSRRLLAAIERLLSEAAVSKEQIDGYAVGIGPGSFTGLRIGMATVKGLAAASELPVYCVSTLDIIAASCTDSRLICAVLDARKREVYSAFYRTDEDGLTKRVSEVRALPPAELIQAISEPVLMVGDGLNSYGEQWQAALGNIMSVAPAHLWSPSASVLGLIGGEMAVSGKATDVADASPLYVRASDAELNLQMRKKEGRHSPAPICKR